MHYRHLAAVVMCAFLLVVALPGMAQQPATPPDASMTYVVRTGETLFRIAVRFGVSVRELAEANGITNPSLIYAGQRLRIPGVLTPTPTAIPPTAAPTTAVSIPTETYVVRPGDTLLRIALRTKTTISRLMALNNLSNPNIIYIGQRLLIPSSAPEMTSFAPATTTPAPVSQPALPATLEIAATATMVEPELILTDVVPAPSTPTLELAPATPELPTAEPTLVMEPSLLSPESTAEAATVASIEYGIEAFLVDQDATALAEEVQRLGFGWVKQTIYWRDFEPVKGQIDFAALDQIVSALSQANLRLMLTVTAAPSWARTSVNENGPADNLSDFTDFISALAARYAGRVAAYEIWNEPNLRREWNSSIYPISAASYLQLLSAAYSVIKATDPAALVISAGLAPTGFNDGVNAINDRIFLAQLYGTGLAAVSDGIGAHPLGWANPPDSVCCEQPVGVETHYQDPSFYFRNTLDDYRQIMVNNGDGDTRIWVTKFGWGTSEDTSAPSQNNIFLTYTTLGEQAIYVTRAFELAQQLGTIGPMFLYNLDGCQSDGPESCPYSLRGPDGSPRPVFAAVQQMLNAGSAANTSAAPDTLGANSAADSSSDATAEAPTPAG